MASSSVAVDSLRTKRAASFHIMQAFFRSWLKLDITQIAAALTIFGTLSGALRVVKSLGSKFYWWFTRFCTASISIASNDRLNREILNWLGAQVLTRQGTRILTASTETIQTDAWRRQVTPMERNDYHHEKRVPIQYLPTFGTTWFVLDRNIFLVRRIPIHSRTNRQDSPAEYADAPQGDEPLVVLCLGRSVTPIKRFLTTCRDFADKQREAFITVRATKDKYHRELWDTTILRPIRPLETVHFDESVRDELAADIENYLDPVTRKFYTARGIPYRRGYLLHGYPGTGKTSLSLALAGRFGLELYLVHLPSVPSDMDLERLFTALPPRCIVLLEDIDAVGATRIPDENGEDDEDEDRVPKSRCTLSGLLNVLDGVSSQEGRIVLMTSNMAHKLDTALIRPGRIDKMIFLGNISHRSAELMFLRMFAPDATQELVSPLTVLGTGSEELQKLAVGFGVELPADTFTPAQLQGYLLNHRSEPLRAVADLSAWVEEEKGNMAAAKERAQKGREARKRKKEEAAVKFLNRSIGAAGLTHSGPALGVPMPHREMGSNGLAVEGTTPATVPDIPAIDDQVDGTIEKKGGDTETSNKEDTAEKTEVAAQEGQSDEAAETPTIDKEETQQPEVIL